MRIRGRTSAPHNALDVLEISKNNFSHHAPNEKRGATQNDEEQGEKKTYERVNQYGVIKSPNPARIQRLAVENFDTLQVPQSLQPVQTGRLVYVRWDFSGFSTLPEKLRGRVTRFAGSGNGERAGGSGGGLGPGVQTRHGSREAEDVGQHFCLGVRRAGERTTWWKGRCGFVCDAELSVKHGKCGLGILSRVTRSGSQAWIATGKAQGETKAKARRSDECECELDTGNECKGIVMSVNTDG